MTPLVILAAIAGAPAFPPVIEPLDGGTLDWTSLRLEASARSERQVGAWKDRAVQEQDALDRLTPRILGLAPTVRVTATATAGDLLASGDDTAQRVREGMAEWKVEETRYQLGGGVEMDAVLDLQAWLRPVLVTLAAPSSLPPTPSENTGLIVDARGLGFEPCLVPTVRAGEADVLFDVSHLVAETVRRGPPVIYVVDPADPRAYGRIGERPLFARARSVEGCDVLLEAADVSAVRGSADLAAITALGRVVLVVDP